LLDGIVRHRRARGLHGLAVNWGPWAGGGMATGLSEVDTARISETGVTPLEADDAFALLEQLLAMDQTQAIVADVDWGRAAAAYSPRRVPPCIDALIAAAGITAEGIGNLVETLRGMSADERVAAMIEAVTKCLCSVLRLSAGDIEAHQSLRDLGLDSLMGMELRHKLERMLGAPVPVALLLKSPRVAELAEQLIQAAGLDGSGGFGSDVAAQTNAVDRWLVRIGGANPAKPRLLCFHHLGGGAEYFTRWAEPLTRDFEVVAVQLPGRGDRADEATIRSFEEMFDALLPRVIELPATGSLLLYGHSMGSHLAFECVRRLRLQGVFVAHLFVSGLWSPRDHAIEKDAVQRLKLTDVDMDLPQALRDDPIYMDALRGLVHADAALLTSYGGWRGEQGLDVPITAFAGDHDPIAPAGKVAAWSACTTAGFTHHVLPGRHMFPTTAFDRLHACIRHAAARLPS
jgi:surfactin synthase thioesterase subunit/acyl carrier protein